MCMIACTEYGLCTYTHTVLALTFENPVCMNDCSGWRTFLVAGRQNTDTAYMLSAVFIRLYIGMEDHVGG